MKSLSGSRFTLLFAALVLVMLATRFKHFGDVLHLPDASMAIFFSAVCSCASTGPSPSSSCLP